MGFTRSSVFGCNISKQVDWERWSDTLATTITEYHPPLTSLYGVCYICNIWILDATFPNRWIRRDGPTPWPPRSPDITPLDFFIWRYVTFVTFGFWMQHFQTGGLGEMVWHSGHHDHRISAPLTSFYGGVLRTKCSQYEFQILKFCWPCVSEHQDKIV